MLDPEYERIYLDRICEIVRFYEKQMADLTIENEMLKHAAEMLGPRATPSHE